MKDYKLCIVSLLDILGYKEIIKDDESVNNLFNALTDAIEEVKKDVECFIKKDSQTNGNRGLDTVIQKLKYRAFSDNIVVSCELDPSPEDKFGCVANAVAIGTVLMIQANIQTKLLIDHGYLSRGGTVIGYYYINSEFVFGKAIVDAYELEQNAKYPRNLVDDKVISYFQQFINETGRDESLNNMLIEDFDGEHYIDYLRASAHIGKILFDEPESDYGDLLERHGRAIDEFSKRNHSSIDKDRGIRQKLAWVKLYHNL